MRKVFTVTIDIEDDPEGIVSQYWIFSQLYSDYDAVDDYRYHNLDITVKEEQVASLSYLQSQANTINPEYDAVIDALTEKVWERRSGESEEAWMRRRPGY